MKKQTINVQMISENLVKMALSLELFKKQFYSSTYFHAPQSKQHKIRLTKQQSNLRNLFGQPYDGYTSVKHNRL